MAVGIEHVLVGGEHAEKATANLGSMTSSLDATLPPTPLRNLLAADGAGVFVLSPDADLQSVVQQAGGEQFPVYSASDWRQLIEAIESGRCGIVLLDVAAVAPRLEKRLAELDRYADRLVILVAAERDDADGLIALLSERRIHRLLIKPAALGITRLLLESAVSRWFEMREARRESNAAATAPAWHPNQLGRHWLVVTLIAAGIIAAASIAVKSLNPSGGTDGASPALAGGSAPSAAAARSADSARSASSAWVYKLSTTRSRPLIATACVGSTARMAR
jgi:hypothetical protein